MKSCAKVRIEYGSLKGLVGWAKPESQGGGVVKIRVYPPKSTTGIRSKKETKSLTTPDKITILQDDEGIFSEFPDIKRELVESFTVDQFI